MKLNLSPSYLNTRRLEILARAGIPVIAQTSIANNSGERAAAMAFASQVADRLLKNGRFPTLTPELVDKAAEDGYVLAQIWDVFNFKGVAASVEHGAAPGVVSGSITLAGEQYTVTGELLPDHHYSASTGSDLRGRKRMLLAGRFEVAGSALTVSPYIVGDLVDDIDEGFADWGLEISWRSHVRVYPEQIGEFEKVRHVKRATAAEVRLLNEMPEEHIKNAFAAIIGEPFIPKDWGGEKSDLQTNNLTIRGEPASAAFVFKGPGVPGELHPNRLGSRGDQLIRAFDEPVELVVVQHHNKIANTVVREAESLASNPFRPRRFCVLDGVATARILKAYDLLPTGAG